MNRYRLFRFAHVDERVSTKSVVGLIIENSKSNQLAAQGPNCQTRYFGGGDRVNSGGGLPDGQTRVKGALCA